MTSSLKILLAQICYCNPSTTPQDSSSTHSSSSSSDDNTTNQQQEERNCGVHIKRCDQHEGSIIIYHIDNQLCTISNIYSPSLQSNNNNDEPLSTTSESIIVGSELLSINEHRISGNLNYAQELLYNCLTLNNKKVNMIISVGQRGRGTLYLLAKVPISSSTTNNKRDSLVPNHLMASQSRATLDQSEVSEEGIERERITTSSSSSVPLSSSSNCNVIDGLELEETNNGARGGVRIISHYDINTPSEQGVVTANNNNSTRRRRSSLVIKSKGIFTGLRFNIGDYILTINGIPVHTVDDVRVAISNATLNNNHEDKSIGGGVILLPILTYNIFRRLKSTVMSAVCSVNVVSAFGMNVSSLKTAAASNGDGMVDIDEKNGKGVEGRRSRRKSLSGSSEVGKRINIEDIYNVHEKLGEGAFAVVKRATHKQTNESVAIKIVNRSSLNRDIEAALKDEIMILNELCHDHIMRLDDVVVTINHYYLVAEYLEGGELFDRIVEKSSYTEKEARDVCTILFGALSYTHSKGIVHRDLKPENILLKSKNSDSEIKIADFGFAKQATDDCSLSTMCGTPGYVAPEILRKEKYGTKADMWSLGVIIFIMLGGYPPFYADSPRKLLRLSKTGVFSFDPEYWGNISDGVKDMIRDLLGIYQSKRPSADESLKHPWMNERASTLRRSSLAKTQDELKKYLARRRFKMAIHSIIFVNNFSGANAVFSGRDKRRNIRALEQQI